MRQGLFSNPKAGFIAISNTPFMLKDGTITTVLRTKQSRTRTGPVDQELRSISGDTKMATAKGKSSKSSGKAKGGKGPMKASPPAIMMANLKGKKSK